MDPLVIILVPGILGGVVFAVILFLVQRRPHSEALVMPYRADPISTDMINMASIKVAGVGGFGLVAMAAAVALGVPRIFQSMAVALFFGTVAAAIAIAVRSRKGPLPSSGRNMGANTTLSIDPPA